MKGIRGLIAWWRSKRCNRSGQLPPKRMPVPVSPTVTAALPTGPTLAGERGDLLASRALLQAAVSVPRRAAVTRAAPASSASCSSGTDEGMSMLPAAMLLASYSCDGAAADEGSFGLRDTVPVGDGGTFDGGGASGSWDSGGSDTASSFSSD